MAWFGEWIGQWFGTWFGDSSAGPTTHTGTGNATIPAITTSGTGVRYAAWRPSVSYVYLPNRRTITGAGRITIPAMRARGRGQHHRRHRGAGSATAPAQLSIGLAYRHRRFHAVAAFVTIDTHASGGGRLEVRDDELLLLLALAD